MKRMNTWGSTVALRPLQILSLVGLSLSACAMPNTQLASNGDESSESADDSSRGAKPGAFKPGSSASKASQSKNKAAKKSAPRKEGEAFALEDGSVVENLPALNDLMKPPPFNPKWNAYMPHNPGGSPGKTFYIAENGKDSNPGTEAAPWATLQKAADTLQPGQTVLIKNGIYDETDLGPKNWEHTNIRRSGAPGKYITFKNYPGHTPTFMVRSWNGIQINGASYIHIEGLEVRGIDDPEVHDLEDPNHFGNGISVIDTDNKDKRTTTSHHIRIIGNHIHHVGGNGIAANGGLIAGNIIHHVSHRSQAGNSCISTGGNQAAASGKVGKYATVIAGNILYNCVNLHKFISAGMITDGNGVIVDYMRDVPFYGTNGKRILIANNIAFNNGGRGFHVYKSGYVDVFHNLAVANLRSHTMKNDGELTAGESDSVRFVGNIAIAAERRHPFNEFRSNDIEWHKNIFIAKNGTRFRGYKKKHPTDILKKDPDWLKLKNLTVDPATADFRPTAESPFLDWVDEDYVFDIDFFEQARRAGDMIDAGPIEFHPEE